MSSAPSIIDGELLNYKDGLPDRSYKYARDTYKHEFNIFKSFKFRINGFSPPLRPSRLQELEQMRSRIARDEVNVEVDSGVNKPELGSILAGLRTQYEGIVKKNKEEAEQWYQKKVEGGGN